MAPDLDPVKISTLLSKPFTFFKMWTHTLATLLYFVLHCVARSDGKIFPPENVHQAPRSTDPMLEISLHCRCVSGSQNSSGFRFTDAGNEFFGHLSVPQNDQLFTNEEKPLNSGDDSVFEVKPEAPLPYPPHDWFLSYPNEWQYSNFDSGAGVGAPDRIHSTYVHNTFPDLLTLIKSAQSSVRLRDASFRRWFGANNPTDIMTVLERMAYKNFGSNPPVFQATNTLWHAVNRVNDSTSDLCTTQPDMVAYMYHDLGEWHWCPNRMTFGSLSDLNCATLPPAVGLDSWVAAAITLHELTHWNQIGEYALGRRIGDTNASFSPYACFTLPDDQKIVTANNYALHALVRPYHSLAVRGTCANSGYRMPTYPTNVVREATQPGPYWVSQTSLLLEIGRQWTIAYLARVKKELTGCL